jgi:hypothetical protein
MISYYFDGGVGYYGHIPESVLVRADGVVTGKLSNMPVKPSAWPEAPHVALANSTLKPNAVLAFTRRYGPINEPEIRLAEGVRALGARGLFDAATVLTPEKTRNLGMDGAVHETFSFSLHDFAELQDQIRLAWRGDRTALGVLRQRVNAANFQVSLYQNPGKLEKVLLRTPLLWEFICVIFLIDYDAGRARICANDRCETPYFLQQRTDQECCCHHCAVERNNARRAEQKRIERKKR